MTSHEEAIQRAGVFAFLPAVLAENGVDPARVFDGLGIDPAGLRHDTMVPLAAMLVALDRGATMMNCPHLGLLIGERFSFSIHGPIGQLMCTAPTLGQAIIDFVTWQQGYSNSAVVYLNKMGDEIAFGFGAYDRSSPGSVQLYDGVMAVGCRIVSTLTEGRARPLEVLLNHRRPDDARPYQAILGAPIRFDQFQTCMVFDRRTLQTPLPGSDPDRRAVVLEQLEELARRMLPRMSTRVAHRLKPLLHMGRPQLKDMAKALDIHPRTLRRHLKADDSTFEEIRDRVRFTLACELLDMTDLPIVDVSAAVHFGSHAAFTTAFRRWTDMTPRDWRATRRSARADAGGEQRAVKT